MADDSEVSLISGQDELEELLAHLRERGRFAFDTEFVSEETFEPVLCLIQVATEERLVAIDPLAFPEMGSFWDVVNDRTVSVVMHAAGEDLRICRFQSGMVPARVFDVQIAAGFAGLGYPLSLSNLVSQTLGETLFGGETRTDWRRRPLSASQLRYALDDVRYLLPLADLLQSRVQELGREEWMEAEVREFLEAIQDRDLTTRWRKLPSLHQLSRRGLESARRLYNWRSAEARRQNRPMRQVLRDDVLVAIARRQPSSQQELEALRDFNRPQLLSKSREILAQIAESQTLDARMLPEHAERHDDGPGVSMLVNLLAAALATCCSKHKVAGGLVGSTQDLKELIRWQQGRGPAESRPSLTVGWRNAVCGETLLDVLAGRSALRVVDLDAEIPVTLETMNGEPRAT
ncbi:MAG: HRDC domain-containing protein [Isosphaeraceae bacterium]